MQHPLPDMMRLNEPERRILRLLAEGHTVKSVAALLETTTGSINERLREARRKTGAGSSRELARLLRDQKNWDDIIGVADGSAAASGLATASVGFSRSWRSKGLAMATIILALAAAAALSGIGQSDTQDLPDPMIAAAMGSLPGPRERHAQLLAESRDVPWADATERRLEMHYRENTDIGPVLRIICRRTLCEVAGSFRPGLTSSTLQAAMDRIQIEAIAEAKRMGLEVEASSFGFRKSPAPTQSFVTHLSRVGG